jgi:hypothetical protein
MARKSNLNTLLNNFLKNPNNLLYLGGAVVAGYFLFRNFAVPKALPPAAPAPQPVLTKTQIATDDGSNWTYGNVSNDDISPGGGPSFAKGVAHNQSILDKGYEQFHSPGEKLAEVTDEYVDEVANSFMGTATPSHDYVTSVVPSNSSGPIANFDTNNEVVEVVDYSP